MFSLLKKNKNEEFIPTKEMVKAAILKGQRIGLKKEEIIEMVLLMDKKKSRKKIEIIVDRVLS